MGDTLWPSWFYAESMRSRSRGCSLRSADTTLRASELREAVSREFASVGPRPGAAASLLFGVSALHIELPRSCYTLWASVLERKMNEYIISFLFGIILVLLAAVPALSQTPQGHASQVPAAQKGRAPENLPWTRFHPAASQYRPTDTEKQQIQAKIDQLDGMVRELQSTRADDGLLADVEIYAEAARWKMAYEEEFFRQVSVADTLRVLDNGLERAAQLKEGKSPWTSQKGRVVRGFRSALDGSAQLRPTSRRARRSWWSATEPLACSPSSPPGTSVRSESWS